MKTRRPCPKCADNNPDNFYGGSGKKEQTYCKSCANSYSNDWKKKHPKQRNKWSRRWSRSETGRESRRQLKQNLRTKCLEKLGNKCSWNDCGWTDTRALQIDHVKGGGNKERKELKGTWAFYKKVLADNSDTYQLLCANHNMIKRAVNNEFRPPNKGKFRDE